MIVGFVSPDPFIQSPYRRQSYNRYSYVWHNPTGATDPSGYFLEAVAVEIPSFLMGLYSFNDNFKNGNYLAASVDGVGMIGDMIAAALPVPGGFGYAIAASRAGMRNVDVAMDISHLVDNYVVANKVSPCAQVLQARQRQALMLEDNVGFNISPTAWDSYPTIGRNGTFISDRQGITDIIGDFSGQSQLTLDKAKVLQLEEAFGLERGALQEGFKIRQVDNVVDRMTRSPMEGNQYFLGPGNHLPGGAPEMVIDPIPTVDTKGVTTLL